MGRQRVARGQHMLPEQKLGQGLGVEGYRVVDGHQLRHVGGHRQPCIHPPVSILLVLFSGHLHSRGMKAELAGYA